MSLQGELTVRLAWDGRRVVQVDIHSSRPLIAGRLVAGKLPAEAAAMLPRLFSICGRAQAAAAASALDAAAGVASAPVLAAREPAVVLETIQEYLWRILVDWPRATARSPVPAAVGAVRNLIVPALRAMSEAAVSRAIPPELVAALEVLAEEHVYGEPVDEWRARGSVAAFAAWAAAGSTLPALLQRELMTSAPGLARSATMLMPATGAELLEAIVPALRSDPSFAATPYWNGMTVETGALARVWQEPLVAALAERDGHTVAVRSAARLTELARLLERARRPFGDEDSPRWVEAFALAAGEGLAAVQTARGLLLHRARLAAGRVADYQIVAPTEWNFHPAGPLVQGLEGTAAPDVDTLEQHARLAVQALDPCVACNIEIAHVRAGEGVAGCGGPAPDRARGARHVHDSLNQPPDHPL